MRHSDITRPPEGPCKAARNFFFLSFFLVHPRPPLFHVIFVRHITTWWWIVGYDTNSGSCTGGFCFWGYVPISTVLLRYFPCLFFGAWCRTHLADSHTMVAGGFCKSLSLWRANDPAECAVAIHIPWATSDALGLVEIRWEGE